MWCRVSSKCLRVYSISNDISNECAEVFKIKSVWCTLRLFLDNLIVCRSLNPIGIRVSHGLSDFELLLFIDTLTNTNDSMRNRVALFSLVSIPIPMYV